MDEAYGEATGQQWDEADFEPAEVAAEAAIAAEAAAPAVARGVEAPAERPSVRRGAVSEALADSPVREPAITTASALAGLDEAQARNPARQALARGEAAPPAELAPEAMAAPPEAAAEQVMAQEAAAPQDEFAFTQPLPGEEPMFAQDENGAPTQEVVGYTNPATKAFRAIGEPPADALTPPVAEAGPLPELARPSAAAPIAPITETAVEWTQPAEVGGLKIGDRLALLDNLKKPPPAASMDVKAGRSVGQSVALGLSEPPALKGQSKAFTTAYNLGLKEGQAALATAAKPKLVSVTSRGEVPPTTRVAKKGSKVAAPKAGKITPSRDYTVEDRLATRGKPTRRAPEVPRP